MKSSGGIQRSTVGERNGSCINIESREPVQFEATMQTPMPPSPRRSRRSRIGAQIVASMLRTVIVKPALGETDGFLNGAYGRDLAPARAPEQ
jgi:hypothetical protein